MIPSKYQSNIYNFIQNESGNATINAVAGSGKTTTIVQALRYIPSHARTIFFAFNKSIVEELKTRVPSSVFTYTLHGFGWSALRYKFGKHIQLNKHKARDLVRVISPQWDDVPTEEMDGYVERVLLLVDFARFSLADSVEEVLNLADRHGVALTGGEDRRALIVIKKMNLDTTQFDFVDMIYQPVIRRDIRLFTYDYVFIDEAQDLNKAQQELVKKVIKFKTGRFIAVGDPRQAIYGFAGADAKSFANLSKIPNTTSLPLSVSYRCGKKIVQKAQGIVPHIEPFEGNEDGEVKLNGTTDDILDGDMVLCRNTAPLVSMCLDFLADEKKAYVKGGDLGANLAYLVSRQKAESLHELLQKLPNELEKIVIRYVKRGMDPEDARQTTAYELMVDKIEVLKILIARVETLDELLDKIATIFAEDKAGICFSTIHKSKGLESDRVHIIQPQLMPSKYARQAWQKTQEKNLEYVAITRAKKLLNYIR